MRTSTVIAATLAIAVVVAWGRYMPRPEDRLPDFTDTVGVPAAVAPVAPGPVLQDRRRAFIDEMIVGGIVSKVDMTGSMPRVWVTAAWHALHYDDKSATINVVWAYCLGRNEAHDLVRLVDSRSGKKVGLYGEPVGGLKME